VGSDVVGDGVDDVVGDEAGSLVQPVIAKTDNSNTSASITNDIFFIIALPPV
jgi:hypothetical protein